MRGEYAWHTPCFARDMVAFAPTVASSNARRVLAYGIRRGLPAAEATLEDGARLPLSRMFAIWAHLARRLDAPDLPIALASDFAIEQLELLGFVTLTAPTLRESLATFARYAPLLNDGRRWEIVTSRAQLVLRLVDVHPRSLGVRLSHETTFAQLAQAVRALGPTRLDPLAVRFAHAPPKDIGAHRAFFRCGIEFDAADDEVVFARDALDEAPRAANAALWRYLCGDADRALARLAPKPLSARIEEEIARAVARGETPSMPTVAAQVGMTERSLRRALTTPFRELVDTARRERARALLRAREASVTRIALDLGFGDAAAFTHACRRWFGAPPSALLGPNERGRAARAGAARAR